jgi:hypothetical protein
MAVQQLYWRKQRCISYTSREHGQLLTILCCAAANRGGDTQTIEAAKLLNVYDTTQHKRAEEEVIRFTKDIENE